MLKALMQKKGRTPSAHLRVMWDRLSGLPGGKRLFSKMVGRMAPYTGTINALVVDLKPGYARLEMADRPAVRNHLRCVHAIALMNLAEETSGLAMLSKLPGDARGILTGLSIDYFKKARGRLTSECHADVEATNTKREVTLEVGITNGEGEVVARAQARWLVGPAR